MLFYNWWLSDPSNNIMSCITIFHDILMMLLLSIAVLVAGLVWLVWYTPVYNNTFTHDEVLEVVWTVFPIGVFLILAIPSIATLYTTEDFNNSVYTMVDQENIDIKMTAHQWYWEVHILDWFADWNFDMYMLPLQELSTGNFLNLEVDNPIYFPLNNIVNFYVTSSDVLHSFAIPSWGVKADCVPGRLNTCYVRPLEVGVFYGQCSEICGANHSFMPINIEIVYDELPLPANRHH